MAGMPGKEYGKEEFRVRVPITFERLWFEDAVSIVCGLPIMLRFTDAADPETLLRRKGTLTVLKGEFKDERQSFPNIRVLYWNRLFRG